MTNKAEMRITNMVVTGQIPLKKRLDYSKIMKRSTWEWQVTNEELSPILSVRFQKAKRPENVNVQGRYKSAYLSLWHSGKFNIVGITTFAEAKRYYNLLKKELKKIGVR